MVQERPAPVLQPAPSRVTNPSGPAFREEWLNAYRAALMEHREAHRIASDAAPETREAAVLLVKAAELKCRAIRMVLDGAAYRPPRPLPWTAPHAERRLRRHHRPAS